MPRSTIQVSYSTRSPELARDVQQLLLEFGVIIAAGFAVLNALFERLRARPRWGVRDISDPAGLPLAALLDLYPELLERL